LPGKHRSNGLLIGKKKSYWIRFPVALALAASMFAVLSSHYATNAYAEDTQCGSSQTGNYHDGIQTTPSGSDVFEGISAQILNEASSVCDSVTGPGKGNYAAAYTMATDGSAYIQTGFTSWYNSGGQHFFGQISDPYDSYGHTSYSTNTIANGLTTHYWEEYRTVCSCIQGLVNGDVYVSTHEDPTIYWGQIVGQWSAETYYPGSDVPGYSTSKVHFSGLETQDLSNNWNSKLDTTSSYNDQASDWSQSAITSGNGLGYEWHEWTAAA
jgi:hypothetical protein